MSLKPLEDEGVRLNWKAWRMPVDAAPPDKPEGYGMGAQLFLKQLINKTGLTIHPPSQTRDTILAHIGGKYAKAKGLFTSYHLRLFKAVWEFNEDIEDVAVLAGIAEEVGLNRESFLKSLEHSEYRSLVEADFVRASESKIWTIPSYIGKKGTIQVHHYENIPDLKELSELLDF